MFHVKHPTRGVRAHASDWRGGHSRRGAHARRRAMAVGVATTVSAARSGGDGKRHAGRAVRGRVTEGAGATCPRRRRACEALLNGLLGV